MTATLPARRLLVEHHQEPESVLQRILDEWDWNTVEGATACGRFSRHLNLPRVPVQQAQVRARFRHRRQSPPQPPTVPTVSWGQPVDRWLGIGAGETNASR